MTARALFVGFLLGVALAGFTYINDHVIEQTFIIGNHLPPAVFGFGLVLLLGVNPLLRLAGRAWTFKPAELALIFAMGLAVCGWPSSNLLRVYTQLVAYPAQSEPLQSNWRATNIFAYIPGTAPILAEGYITDWPALNAALRRADDPDAPPALARLHERLDTLGRQAVAHSEDPELIEADDRRQIITAVNEVLRDPTYYHADVMADLSLPPDAAALAEAARQRPLTPIETVALNRAVLEQAVGDGGFAPPPAGDGVLLIDGQTDPYITGSLFGGAESDQTLGPADVPWAAWWPTHRLWIGTALLVGLATLGMVLIVHPQWTGREQLIYPTVKFVNDMTEPGEGGWLPAIARNRMFWIGAGICVVVHTANGLHAWYEIVPEIPRQLDFNPMRGLLPAIAQMPGSWNLFAPTVYFAVVGFGFLITARVAMSVGLSNVAFVCLGAIMLGFGEPLGNGRFNVEAEGGALRFGAYVGLTAMILYLGRRHYLNVAAASIGLKRLDETPAYTVWAARGMVLASAGAVYLLTRYGGLDVLMSTLLVLCVLMIGLVLTRINAETGLFYAQPDWIPAVIFAGIFGAQGMGPTSMIVLTMGSLILAADPREAIAPYLANGLAMTQRVGHTPPRRAAWPILAMLVVGLLVALVVTMTVQYNRGIRANDGFPRWLPHGTLDNAAAAVDELVARDQLVEATSVAGLERLVMAQPNLTTVSWVLVGLALVSACSYLRLRFAWWPLHPILFIVWGTYPANNFAFSFLLAAIIKAGVQKIGGERLVRSVKPLMIGLIAGDILMVGLWAAAGAAHFAIYDSVPSSIRIFPG